MDTTCTELPPSTTASISGNGATRLFNKNVVFLWIGQFISEVGTSAFFIAMLFWLKHETNSAAIMGAMGMLAKVPGILLGPIAGVAADRWSRRKIMIVCDVIDGVLVLSLGIWMVFFPGATTVSLIWLGVVCAVNEVTNAFFIPAEMAALPDLVPQRSLAAANTIERCLQEISGLSGTVLGSALTTLAGATAFFALNGMSYFVSAACLLLVSIPRRRSPVIEEDQRASGSLTSNIRQGFAFLRGQKGLLLCKCGSWGLVGITAIIWVLFPFYVEDVLGKSSIWFGYLATAGGVGAFSGMALAAFLNCDGRERLIAIGLALLLFAGGSVPFAFIQNPTIAIVLVLLGGTAVGFATIQIETLTQLHIPTELRGRVLSLLSSIQAAVFGIGIGLGGIVGEWLGHNVQLIYLICGLCLCAGSGLLLLNRHVRSFLSLKTE